MRKQNLVIHFKFANRILKKQNKSNNVTSKCDQRNILWNNFAKKMWNGMPINFTIQTLKSGVFRLLEINFFLIFSLFEIKAM